MSAFEEAVWLSSEKWVDSFPNDLPKHHFSKKHNKIIHEIIYGKQEKAEHKISKGTVKVLLIAAILLAFATTVFAIPTSREYIIEKFFNHSSYNVKEIYKINSIESFEINYIPDGFVVTDEYKSNYFYSSIYTNKEFHFCIEKHAINTYVGFDTEKYDCENILINGIDGLFYISENFDKGIIFNNANYIFVISGNIEKDELVKIAQNLR